VPAVTAQAPSDFVQGSGGIRLRKGHPCGKAIVRIIDNKRPEDPETFDIVCGT